MLKLKGFPLCKEPHFTNASADKPMIICLLKMSIYFVIILRWNAQLINDSSYIKWAATVQNKAG